jgi:HlyD family secretion protein
MAKRVQQLLEQGAVTQEAADKATAGKLSALAAEASARAQITEAQAALQLAEIARKRADIRAPFAGALQQLYPEVGADMVPGSPAFDLLDTTAARIETTIDEADASRIQVGQLAEMTLDAYPGVRFKGKVSLIAPAVAPDPRLGTTRSLPIWIAVEPDPRLRIGMSCTVEIIVAHKENVLFVPSQTVIGRGVERDVYRVEGGVARKLPVQTGISNWDRTEITSGLSEGDAVVTSLDSVGLSDGAHVAASADAGS